MLVRLTPRDWFVSWLHKAWYLLDVPSIWCVVSLLGRRLVDGESGEPVGPVSGDEG